MKVDLLPASDTATYVIFDPAALPHLIRHRDESGFGISTSYDELLRQSELGNALVYQDVGDGNIRVRLYVDEDPEPFLAEATERWLEDSLLHVPSGRVFGMGAEYIPSDVRGVTPETYEPRKGYLGSGATIPAAATA